MRDQIVIGITEESTSELAGSDDAMLSITIRYVTREKFQFQTEIDHHQSHEW